MPAHTRLDHLVVFASQLERGIQWCEATLGVTPGPGGTHPLMGTHNRLINIASPNFPMAYLEIIAIDPAAESPKHRRWFDMDDANLRRLIQVNGPQLIHFVLAVEELDRKLAYLKTLGIDRGVKRHASRPTSGGLLQWQITVREDGQRLFDGCMPTLICWESSHPCQNMPDSGLSLQSLEITHDQDTLLRQALQGLGMEKLGVDHGPACIRAQLQTPRGLVTLRS